MARHERDQFLDHAKALAIILVVAGHYAKGRKPDFDEYLPFRLIYSFHMPAFMFISGMTASFWVRGFMEARQGRVAGSMIAADLRAKVLRLLLPFAVWACVAYFVGDHQTGPLDYVRTLLVAPDNGLWFLPVLFQCTLLMYVVASIVRVAPRWLPRWGAILIAGVIVYEVARRLIPTEYGGYWTKALFPYFVFGLSFYYRRGSEVGVVAPIVGLAIYELMVPFWSRLHPVASLVALPFGQTLNSLFNVALALAGTVALLGGAKWTSVRAPDKLSYWLSVIGQRSLDIYAVHFYFVRMWPPVLGALVVSLAYSTALRIFRITSLIFFGDPAGSALRR